MVEGRSVGSHPPLSPFLKCTLQLRPPRGVWVPSWDLPLVLEAICSSPFEPVEAADLRWPLAKATFPLAFHLQNVLVSSMPCLSLRAACSGILMGLVLLCGLTPPFSLRSIQPFMITSLYAWLFLPHTQTQSRIVRGST